MAEQVYGPRRSRTTRKPSIQCPDVIFYRCNICKSIHQVVGVKQVVSEVSCCGEVMELLQPVQIKEIEDMDITYKIVGGYNDNAIRVSWKLPSDEALEWIYLKTYTGGYMKYLIPNKRPPMIFALADEDAFSYCDEDPCLECVFWCKRGFILYAYATNRGLIEIPIDKASAYWQSDKK